MQSETLTRKMHWIRNTFLSVLFALWFDLSHMAFGQALPIEDRFFEERIRPVLAENCYQCHSESNVSVGLRLDTPVGFRTDDGRGSVLVPGKSEASRLIQAVKNHSSVSPMPPERKLKDEEIRDLESWVDAGATWPESAKPSVSASRANHWAFQPMKRLPTPRNEDERWNQNSIDRWLFHELRSQGLSHSEPASGRQLARRLAFDLTGLPPTLEQVAALEGYESEPAKVSELVNELLESQAFAEHWARHWLDVARYSDSIGALFDQDDLNPNAYTYRDWVVQSFQNDLPYNDFLKLQLNADHQTDANSPDLAALGFLTVGLKFEDNEPDIIDDRLDATFRGLQGLTISCARCHDHKYDPISTEDYYSLYSVFAESSETTVPIFRTDEDRVTFGEYEVALRQHQFAFDRYRDEQHEKRFRKPYLQVAEYLLASTATDPNDALLSVDPNGFRTDGLNKTLVDRYIQALETAKSEHSPIFAPWIAYSRSPTLSSEQIDPLAQEYRLWIDEEPSDEESEERDRVGDDSNHPQRTEDKPINACIATFFLANPPKTKEELAHRYGELFRTVATEWLEQIATARNANQAPPKRLSSEDRDEIRKLMFGEEPALDVSDETLKNSLEGEFQEKFEKLKEEILLFQASDAAPPQARVIVDGGEREQYVFVRGNQDRAGPKVLPHFLTLLDPEQETYLWPSAREQLARSIVDPHNPLTARVWVNRVWGHLFGQGIVATPSDFGVRGSEPTHPELLDGLALDFIKRNWSTQDLIRRIVLSAAYQQASFDRPEMAAIDPENKLLWRMNRKRLSSESIRDSILATSGTLDTRLGGRPIKEESSENRRRTLYSMINRRHPSGLATVFDFANPMMHSPKRHETIVPQQFLWLMNGELATELARELAEEFEGGAFRDAEAGESEEAMEIVDTDNTMETDKSWRDSIAEIIPRIYQRILQREPTEDEFQLAEQFLAASTTSTVPILDFYSAWRYGTATIHRKPLGISDFVEFETMENDTWEQDGFRLNAVGGDAGDDPERAVVRRWIVPENGTIEIKSLIRHYYEGEEQEQVDGVAAIILFNRGVVLKKCSVNSSERELNSSSLLAKAGDTVDFVVHGRSNSDQDHFEWRVDIEFKPTADGVPNWVVSSERHFRTDERPLKVPLSGIAQLGQVLWMSNEFIYID